MKCPKCNKETKFNHVHSTAHGIPETHIVGTERYQCTKCGYSLFKKEGELLGLKFVLD